ncbi:hypothetical protein CLHUN_40320 [Ruminiclostridium hungatei]|uniref:DUF3795 domain-containing protein n=1 Tax=Ruminiclostridium hungatei TaxID=48256 RepID=A0A1V4SF31_RUMHU|nr:DUF3795 domain-containing protein [Ruminiclostridium hungatei]OPX42126.1 hypothetical protein CLHUN_40320 [Ruminiclostridium hungatei]
MKNFNRKYTLFSLCGLNCGLCVMHLDNYCPGCGGGEGNQGCAIARCSRQHGQPEFCHLCGEYPCKKYEGIDAFDSFVTHRNQLKDMDKVRKMGIDAYLAELSEKKEILKSLLANYNDGRRKSFFCIAVNLLELQDIKTVMEQIATETAEGTISGTTSGTTSERTTLALKEKAAHAVSLFQAMADKRSLVLKLNKKPG